MSECFGGSSGGRVQQEDSMDVIFRFASSSLLHCAARGTCTQQTYTYTSSSVCNSSRAGYFQSGAPLARTGIKRSNLASLQDFPNVISPNESNPDDETSHFVVVWTRTNKISMELQTSLSPCK